MKKLNHISPLMGFFSGMVLGIVFLGIVSFTAAPGTGTGITSISMEQAKALIGRYLADAAPTNDVIKGFTIDKAQVEAMNALTRENPALTGFRIYLGRNENNLVRGIVVGMDSQGKEVLNGTIYNTDSKTISPCPPACETSSPLFQP
jgi:hypothetical protein